MIEKIRIIVEEQSGESFLVDILLPTEGKEAEMLLKEERVSNEHADVVIDKELQDIINETRDLLER